MKRLLLCLFTGFFLLFVSCSNNNATFIDGHSSSLKDSSFSEPVSASVNNTVNLDTLDIGGVMFTNLNEGHSVQYTLVNLVNEFRSFISKQDYYVAESECDEYYSAILLDHNSQALLKIIIGSRSAAFDRNVEVNGKLYEKDIIYETCTWLYEYMEQFMQGNVLNPAYIDYPAKLRIPGEYNNVEMVYAGSNNINEYGTLTALHTFVSESFTGMDFEIIGSKVLYGIKSQQEEEAEAARERVIHIECDYSEIYMNVISQNEYMEFIRAYALSLYKDAEKPGIYRLATDGAVFHIKVDDAFDKAFQQLFENDMKSEFKLNLSDVKKIFEQKKPYYMEYICRNLGMEMWNSREDDTMEQSSIKLDNGNSYAVLRIINPYNSRLMFFNNKTGAFIDYINFGGRQAGTDYTVQRADVKAWVVGDKCLGHGTGESIYNREWYTLDDTGKKLALSIPYDTYLVGPYGGSIFHADKIQLVNDDPIRIEVSYSITRVYMLDIAEADEYGQVKITADKKVKFVWDDSQRKFISGYPIDEQGVTQITPDVTGISAKCGAILEKGYDRLLSNIKALDSLENNLKRVHRAGSFELFLRDCPDSTEKAALLMLLSEKASQ
jgi:hypothetical protein